MATDAPAQHYEAFLSKPATSETVTELYRHANISQLIGQIANCKSDKSYDCDLKLKVLNHLLSIESVVDEVLVTAAVHDALTTISKGGVTQAVLALIEMMRNVIRFARSEVQNVKMPETGETMRWCQRWNQLKGLRFFDCLSGLLGSKFIGVVEDTVSMVKEGLELDASLTDHDNLPMLTKVLAEPTFTEALHCMTEQDDAEAQLRLLHAVVEIGVLSRTLFSAYRDAGLYQPLINIIKGDDVLAKLAALGLLNDFSGCKEGAAYLLDRSVSSILIEDLQNPLFDDTTHSHVLVALAAIVTQCTQTAAMDILTAREGVVLRSLVAILQDRSSVSRARAVAVWGQLCTISAVVTESIRAVEPSLPELVAEIIEDSRLELSCSAIAAWARVIAFELQASSKLSNWHERIVDTQVIPQVIDLFETRPFPPVRLNLYMLLLAAVSRRKTMIAFFKATKSSAIFRDPTSESEYETRRAKHAFAEALDVHYGQDPQFATDIGKNNWAEVVRLKTDGPFYVPSDLKPSVDKISG